LNFYKKMAAERSASLVPMQLWGVSVFSSTLCVLNNTDYFRHMAAYPQKWGIKESHNWN
jgi:hypothetical protein